MDRKTIAPEDILVPSANANYLYRKLGEPSWFFNGTKINKSHPFPELISGRCYLTILNNGMLSNKRRELIDNYIASVPLFTARYLALALSSAPSLEHAFELIVRFGGKQSGTFLNSFKIEGDRAIFTAVPQLDLGLALLPLVEGFISYIGSHILLSAAVPKSEVVARVTHDFRPDCSASMPFTVLYSQDRITVEFPAKVATQQSIFFDPGLWQIAEARCEELERAVALNNAIGVLRSQVIALASQNRRMPLLKELAEFRNESPRTLMRFLKSRGVSYKALSDSIHQQRAKELLGVGHYSVEKVASSLGFSDSSSFRRTFRRWTGFNPSEWVKQFSNRIIAHPVNEDDPEPQAAAGSRPD